MGSWMEIYICLFIKKLVTDTIKLSEYDALNYN